MNVFANQFTPNHNSRLPGRPSTHPSMRGKEELCKGDSVRFKRKLEQSNRIPEI